MGYFAQNSSKYHISNVLTTINERKVREVVLQVKPPKT